MARLTREQTQTITREKLLRSARDIVASDGYEGATVERIAEEAGHSKGAFYSNFASKEDILLQLVEDNSGQDIKDLSALLEGVASPDEAITLVAQWCDSRIAEQKWGILLIEFLRRFHRDGTLGDRHTQMVIEQWEEVGRLLLDKLDLAHTDLRPIDMGGIIFDLTYGGISRFLNVTSPGHLIETVLSALRHSVVPTA